MQRSPNSLGSCGARGSSASHPQPEEPGMPAQRPAPSSPPSFLPSFPGGCPTISSPASRHLPAVPTCRQVPCSARPGHSSHQGESHPRPRAPPACQFSPRGSQLLRFSGTGKSTHAPTLDQAKDLQAHCRTLPAPPHFLELGVLGAALKSSKKGLKDPRLWRAIQEALAYSAATGRPPTHYLCTLHPFLATWVDRKELTGHPTLHPLST